MNLDEIDRVFYNKIMEIDSKPAIYKRGEQTILVHISLDDVDELAEVILSNLKITSEILSGIIRKAELGLVPQKGDKIIFEGKTYTLLPIGGKDYFTFVDVSRVVYKIAAFREDS